MPLYLLYRDANATTAGMRTSILSRTTSNHFSVFFCNIAKDSTAAWLTFFGGKHPVMWIVCFSPRLANVMMGLCVLLFVFEYRIR